VPAYRIATRAGLDAEAFTVGRAKAVTLPADTPPVRPTDRWQSFIGLDLLHRQVGLNPEDVGGPVSLLVRKRL
jgi:hypothetical protein